MLTAKQHELLLFIHDRLAETGVSPSFEEMKEALDLKSKSGVHRLIGALEERQFLRRLPNRARALEVMRLPGASNTQSPAPVSDIAAARARKAEAAKALPDDAPAIAVPLVGMMLAGMISAATTFVAPAPVTATTPGSRLVALVSSVT